MRYFVLLAIAVFFLGCGQQEQPQEGLARAACVIKDGTGMYVVIDEDPDNDASALTLPGGHVEAGETPVQGAIREVLEETGLKVTKEPTFLFSTDLTNYFDCGQVHEVSRQNEVTSFPVHTDNLDVADWR